MDFFNFRDKALSVIGFLLIVFVLVSACEPRPAHAATAYPACPLVAGVCAPELPTLAQCDLLVKGQTPPPADVYSPEVLISKERARGLAQKAVCYNGRLALIDPTDLEIGYVRIVNSVVTHGGAHSGGFAIETTPFYAYVWGIVMKRVNGEWMADVNQSPAKYSVTVGVLMNNSDAVFGREHGLRWLLNDKHLTLTYGTVNMVLTKHTGATPDTFAGVCYFWNPSISTCYVGLFPAGGWGVGANVDITQAVPRYTRKLIGGLWPFK